MKEPLAPYLLSNSNDVFAFVDAFIEPLCSTVFQFALTKPLPLVAQLKQVDSTYSLRIVVVSRSVQSDCCCIVSKGMDFIRVKIERAIPT